MSSPHPIQFSFSHIDDKVLGIWKSMDWYYLPACVCTYWHRLGPFWWKEILPKFMLKIGLIMVGKLIDVVSTSSVYRVSNIYSIVNVNALLSWCLYSLNSKFLYFRSNKFMQHCRCFNFKSSVLYLTLRLFSCAVSSLKT